MKNDQNFYIKFNIKLKNYPFYSNIDSFTLIQIFVSNFDIELALKTLDTNFNTKLKKYDQILHKKKFDEVKQI